MSFVEVLQHYPILFLCALFLLGLIVGSFLNVVTYRLPIMMQRGWRQECREWLELEPEAPSAPYNLIVPRSHCPHCNQQISALENIPLFSYLFLKGRCVSCKEPISPRYPLVELITAVLSVVVAWRFGFTWETAFALPLTWALIALSVIDFEHKLLPDTIVLPFLWLGLLASLFGFFTDQKSAILGAVIGYLSLWCLFHLFKLLTGKEGMGYGDFKLLALFGAWLGWQQLLPILVLSSLVGAVVGISLILLRRQDRNVPIPFGPYIAAAGWINLLWGQEIYQQYLQWAGLV